MPGTTTNNAIRYPLATEAPDGPGGMLALASDVDALIQSGSWTPTLGGTGAAIGVNSIVDGAYVRMKNVWHLQGRIVFGSSASLGSGGAVIQSLPTNFQTKFLTGYGLYLKQSGAAAVPLYFEPASTSSVYIRPVRSHADGVLADVQPAFAIGTPTQSDQILFHLDAVV